MARIIVEPASTGNDLPQRFIKALNLLNEKGIKRHSGTKLVSKYVVIVAEDPYKALERVCREHHRVRRTVESRTSGLFVAAT